MEVFKMRPINEEDEEKLQNIQPCVSSELLPEDHLITLKTMGYQPLLLIDNFDKMLAGLAELEVSEDVVYLGLLSVPKGIHVWNDISELCRLCVERRPSYNMFIRIIEEMNQTGYFASSFPIRSEVTLQQAVAQRIEANRLVVRVPGVAVVDLTQDHLRDVVAYDEVIMSYKRFNYINTLTRDSRTLTKLAFEQNAICGFVILQQLADGRALAEHLVADDRHVAKLLLKKAMDEFPPAKMGIILVIPRRPREESVNFADDLQVTVERRSSLAYSRYSVRYRYQKIFSIAEFV
ncbi:uncharacterized protein LOC135366860 [Ornithodoros turicata]|uniref:uncharacterized protein LOC135366860 n=1 Tax=Ornithodoros turicata TaxID=34597 RepID=UPI0031398600